MHLTHSLSMSSQVMSCECMRIRICRSALRSSSGRRHRARPRRCRPRRRPRIWRPRRRAARPALPISSRLSTCPRRSSPISTTPARSPRHTVKFYVFHCPASFSYFLTLTYIHTQGFIIATQSAIRVSLALQTIEADLRKLELELATRHIQILCSFMPETFFKHGGERLNSSKLITLI